MLCLDYFFVFPLFARKFDLKQIARAITWSSSRAGRLLRPRSPVLRRAGISRLVQNYEPRDIAFIDRLKTNDLNPIAANWWGTTVSSCRCPNAARCRCAPDRGVGRYKRQSSTSRAARLRARRERWHGALRLPRQISRATTSSGWRVNTAWPTKSKSTNAFRSTK